MKSVFFLFGLATFSIAFITKSLFLTVTYVVVTQIYERKRKQSAVKNIINRQVNGSEDVKILPNGIAIISSGLRWDSGMPHDPELDNRQGKILMMDLKTAEPKLEEITFTSFDQTGFNPHGISVYVDPDTGRVRLFVVNHRAQADVIEIFQLDQESRVLTHIRSVTDELIFSANSVTATGPESFYVTNDHYFRTGRNPLRTVEMMLQLASGSVVYYDGSRGKYVASGIPFANGINMDQSGKYVYVATVSKKGVLVFRRQENSDLALSQFIPVGSVVDNIFVDENANLWISGPPVALDFLKYTKNLSYPCPSQVINVQLSAPQSTGEVYPRYELREVYSNTGQELKGSTTAAVYNRKLLIGTAYDNLLYCDIKAF